jgi:hexosaminidase
MRQSAAFILSEATMQFLTVNSFPRRIALLMALATLGGSLFAQEPELIPQPREMKATSAPFEVSSGTQIVLVSPVQPDDRTAAASIQKELKLSTGQLVPINVSVEAASDQSAIILGRLDQPAVERLLKNRGIEAAAIGEQGYALDVAPRQVIVAGKDAAGLYYGVQTLRQLVVPTGNGEAKILGVRVRDWPALRYRGTQVDLSRGPVPKLSYLKHIVKTISQFKMNQLYMYIEDSFRMDGQPLVGVLSDTLSRQDWKDLIAYADRYHVDIVPATEACGHLHKILRFEQYSGMAERPHGHVLAPGDPQAPGFLENMYSQMAGVFPSNFYHIGCDETFELGLGRSKASVEKEGYGKVYVDSLVRAYDLVRKYNKQVMFWGDIAVEHPEMIPSLPKGLIVASWEYGYHKSYERWLKPFEGTGMKIFVCPWIGNTSLIIPDDEEAAANIAGFIGDGRKAGAIGTDVTVWNDDGEMLYGLNWWGIVYGAASAWEPHRVDVADFNQKFDWAFYRNMDHRFADVIRDLSGLNEVIHTGNTNPGPLKEDQWGGASDGLYWQDPFTEGGHDAAKKFLPVASYVRKTAEQSYDTIADSESLAHRNADTLDYYKFAALRMDALGMRYQFAQEISDFYADVYAHQKGPYWRQTGDDFENISSTNGRLQDLRDYTTRLRELYKSLWLREHLPTWLPNMLQLYDRESMLWQGWIARISEIRAEHRDGKPYPSPDSLGLLPAGPEDTASGD